MAFEKITEGNQTRLTSTLQIFSPTVSGQRATAPLHGSHLGPPHDLAARDLPGRGGLCPGAGGLQVREEEMSEISNE